MRIHLSTAWALTGAMFSIAAAQGEQPPFLFDGETFRGQYFPGHQSSIFEYQDLEKGHSFTWTWQGDSSWIDIFRVDLMNSNNESILFWCPGQQDCITTEGFNVVPESREIQLPNGVIEKLHSFLKERFFFRLDWRRSSNGKRQQQTGSAYSPEWAIVETDDTIAASSIYTAYSSQMTAGAGPARPQGPTPTTITTASNAGSSAATASTTSSQTTSSVAAASSSGNSGNKSAGLTTGAIVGIVVGVVGGLILVSVIAGCFCFRRRRNGGVDRGGSRGVQDIIAEKEAHTSILDRDQPDTPYSEQNSQQPLNRGLGLAGRNESGVDLGIGQAISGPGSIRTESLHNVAGAGNRNSAVYSSLGGGAANSAHGTPVMGSGPFASGSPRTQPHTPSMSVHDRSSVMGSPVPRASSQLERSLSPYKDNVGQQHEYSQHHHVVDGANLAQQEHSNNRDSVTVRSPSSIYSTNPLDEAQPISPESAREDGKAAAGGVGGSGGGASAHGPPGHGRSGTPSGISGQYAHLVEEGMTDDEIRRLEEEERALDEAIEQAGTTGRKR